MNNPFPVGKDLEAQRKEMIEASIVKIMKSRRTLTEVEVIEEVTKRLRNRFLPETEVIKERIETLITGKYLKRDEKNELSFAFLFCI